MEGARNNEDLPRPPKNPPAALNHQPPPALQCPRCDSFNTKFCYYNNYSLSQPRYFCKTCRRYWTHGGTLRTIPIGGSCRKNKRPRITAPPPSSLSSLSSNLINPRITQGLSTRSPNLLSGQSSRPVVPSLGGSFYSGGSYDSTLAAMQSLPTGINQGAAMMGSGGRFLQGMTFPTLKSHAPTHQHLPPPLSRFFPPQQSLVPPSGRFSSWAQSAINAGAASSSSASSSGLWNAGGAAASGGELVDPSFGLNQWPDNTGFNPSL